MKASRFFRQVWRINALLILLVACLVTLLLGIFAFQLMVDRVSCKSSQAVQVDASPEEKDIPPSLGSFSAMSGTSFLRAPLTCSEQRGHSRFRGVASTRNYLFLNLETLETRWLFSSDKQLIIQSDELQETIQSDDPSSPRVRTIACSYQTVDSDSNGDQQLTPNDKRSLAYSRPDGREYTTAITGIGRILSASVMAGGLKHVVVFESDGKCFCAAISLRTFRVEKKEELLTGGRAIIPPESD